MIGLGIAGCLAISTFVRVQTVWQSDQTLWADAVRTSPRKPRVVMNLGRAYELAGDVVTAEAAYRSVIWLSWDPRRSAYVRRFSQAAAETNLAHLEMKQGHLASALQILDGTLTDFPTFPYAHYNRGWILWTLGVCDLARESFGRAFAADPTLPRPTGACVERPE